MHNYAYVLVLLLPFFILCNANNNLQPSNDLNNQTFGVDTVPQTHDSILCVFQDSKNNYWFGSNGHGVYRYDGGKTFLHYTTRQILPGTQIWKIQEDNKGNIFFTTTKGICKYDGKQFSTLPLAKNDAANNGWKLQQDDLWFQGAQDSGVVYRYDGKFLYRLEFPKTKVAEDFIKEHPRPQFPDMRFNPYDVYSIFKDSRGNVWFGTGMLGVCRYDGKTFTWIPNDKIGMDENAFCVRSVIEDKDGKFWFSNTKHCYAIYNNDTESITEEKGIDQLIEYQEADYAYFMSGFKDDNGDLWLATFGAGVWRYSKGALFHYPTKKGARTITLYSIYKDRQGTIWLGTHTDGVYKFNGKLFERFKP